MNKIRTNCHAKVSFEQFTSRGCGEDRCLYLCSLGDRKQIALASWRNLQRRSLPGTQSIRCSEPQHDQEIGLSHCLTEERQAIHSKEIIHRDSQYRLSQRATQNLMRLPYPSHEDPVQKKNGRSFPDLKTNVFLMWLPWRNTSSKEGDREGRSSTQLGLHALNIELERSGCWLEDVVRWLQAFIC